MSYRTVNVKPETHRRLTGYKIGGATFDEVLAALMDSVPAEILHKRLTRSPEQERIRQSPAAKKPVTPGFVRFDKGSR